MNGDLNQTGKLDIEAVPMINDKPIYDIDLAQMEDRPWRKPGADITDYFNYGFTEGELQFFLQISVTCPYNFLR